MFEGGIRTGLHARAWDEPGAATPKSRALSGHTDWRFEGEGVIPDQCSGSVSALPCVAGNGGV